MVYISDTWSIFEAANASFEAEDAVVDVEAVPKTSGSSGRPPRRIISQQKFASFSFPRAEYHGAAHVNETMRILQEQREFGRGDVRRLRPWPSSRTGSMAIRKSI